MEQMIIGMFAETQVHVGAGESSGFVDLPVARESTTSYPVIPGSGLKGAFKEKAEKNGGLDVKALFGEQENAGSMVFSDARLLLLPVRSLTGHYKWTTCPYLLERLERDISRSKIPNIQTEPIDKVGKGEVLTQGSEKLYLEEREFKIKGQVPDSVIQLVGMFIPNAKSRGRLADQIAILSNDDFKWFAQYGLQVNARNQLTDKKTSGNLWYEETLPIDSVFYMLIFKRSKEGDISKFAETLRDDPYIQIGGNETVGQGWFNIVAIVGE